MSHEFQAIFENGVLRPLAPVDLSEREIVRVVIVKPAAGSASKAPRSLHDALVSAGLLGCIEGGPADVSTNPEHMKGFGE